MAKKVLGRGLDALIPQGVMNSVEKPAVAQAQAAVTRGETAAKGAAVTEIPVSAITANPQQPRKRFDAEKLKSLSQSIQADGVLQPVVVRKRGDRYELIMGERRLQAARLAGVQAVPALVREAEDGDSLRLALVENMQREDLNPIEVAEAYRALIDRFGLSQSELARLIGRDRSSVANTLRLLGLPQKVRTMIIENKLSEGHARALLALATGEDQMAFADRIVKRGLTVRQVEREVGARRSVKTDAVKKPKPSHISFLENAVSQHLSTRVSIEEKSDGKGKIMIEFYSHEDFERLVELMRIPIPR